MPPYINPAQYAQFSFPRKGAGKGIFRHPRAHTANGKGGKKGKGGPPPAPSTAMGVVHWNSDVQSACGAQSSCGPYSSFAGTWHPMSSHGATTWEVDQIKRWSLVCGDALVKKLQGIVPDQAREDRIAECRKALNSLSEKHFSQVEGVEHSYIENVGSTEQGTHLNSSDYDIQINVVYPPDQNGVHRSSEWYKQMLEPFSECLNKATYTDPVTGADSPMFVIKSAVLTSRVPVLKVRYMPNNHATPTPGASGSHGKPLDVDVIVCDPNAVSFEQARVGTTSAASSANPNAGEEDSADKEGDDSKSDTSKEVRPRRDVVARDLLTAGGQITFDIVRLVKHWARTKKINSAFNGSLNSMTWVLLVISYFQQCGIIPPYVKTNLSHRMFGAPANRPVNSDLLKTTLLQHMRGFLAFLDDLCCAHYVVDVVKGSLRREPFGHVLTVIDPDSSYF